MPKKKKPKLTSYDLYHQVNIYVDQTWMPTCHVKTLQKKKTCHVKSLVIFIRFSFLIFFSKKKGFFWFSRSNSWIKNFFCDFFIM